MMHYPKSREEWLALRHKHVSSTESSALFGMNKYMTAYELAVMKRGDSVTEWEGSERSEWGLAMQEAIARQVGEKYGVKVRALNGYASNNGIGASFDFEIVGFAGPEPENRALREMYAEHGSGVLEIKNVDWLVFKKEWLDDEAPAHIEIQVQHQLECIERPWAVIAALIGGNKLHLLTRLRDPDVGASISSKAQQFWSNLNKGILPPVTLPEDAALISQLYRYAEPGKVLDAQSNDEIKALCHEYAQGGETERAGKSAKDTAKAKLLMLIGDAERVLTDGYSISAGVTAEAEIPAYTRKAFRNLRITAKKEKK